MTSITITKTIEWDMGHRVPFHHGKCRFPHGHRYRLEVTVEGPISTNTVDGTAGMIMDFKEIKDQMKAAIQEPLDHCFLAYQGDPLFAPLAQTNGGAIEGIYLVPFIPTAENIALWCHEKLQKAFSHTIRLTRVRLYETPNSYAEVLS